MAANALFPFASSITQGLSRQQFRAHWIAAVAACLLAWPAGLPSLYGQPYKPAPGTTPPATGHYDWVPGAPNAPIGVAQGIHPGRVVWTRDPAATRWAGNWKQNSDQYWTDDNTDQARVEAMLSSALRSLTGAATDEAAWTDLFVYHNRHALGMEQRGYHAGEIVAVKINLNNSEKADKADNKIDASPQVVMAMVHQLVNRAHVRPADIIVYDARRFMTPAILRKVWAEYAEVRFVQVSEAQDVQPMNPALGSHHGLEAADWVQGVTYSGDSFKDAMLIPRQILDASYLVNLALLKDHSYPYDTMENGDEGQTAVTMCGKNYFGSIKGTPELHADINTSKRGVKNAYSPIVDLSASPNLGGKAILWMLDGLYSGRKWRSYPQHFPNPPFNNRVEPYENPDWPASLLLSQDPVAIDSVGLDVMYSQSQNNIDPVYGKSRILIRENADDYMVEMADPEHAPSKTHYVQGGKPVPSLGVHEHWDSDATRRYTRNLDPVNGRGIELVYLPVGGANAAAAPAALPGQGLAQHSFFYAGESKRERMFIVREGRIAWSYEHAGKGEISDAVLMSNGNVLFAHQFGVTEIDADKKVVWNFDAPANTEIHTAQPIGSDRVVFIENGDPARLVVMNKATGKTERKFVLPVKNPKSIHGHFRHARLTADGTILVAHMDLAKVCEYDLDGNVLWSMDTPGGVWSAVPLRNGNILLTGGKAVREVNRNKETVWQWTPADTPDFPMPSLQLATRLPNGNTLINNWSNEWSGSVDTSNPPLQAIEVTPDRKVVWALRSWAAPADLGPATTIQILDEPSIPENVRFGEITGAPAG